MSRSSLTPELEARSPCLRRPAQSLGLGGKRSEVNADVGVAALKVALLLPDGMLPR